MTRVEAYETSTTSKDQKFEMLIRIIGIASSFILILIGALPILETSIRSAVLLFVTGIYDQFQNGTFELNSSSKPLLDYC